jgi:hypothetical protein
MSVINRSRVGRGRRKTIAGSTASASSPLMTMPNAAPHTTPAIRADFRRPESTYFDAAMAPSSVSDSPGRCGLASCAMVTTTGIAAKQTAPAAAISELPVSRRMIQ